MGLKAKCRPLNKVKNDFLEWLKENKAENIDEYEGEEGEGSDWDYYRNISAFVGNTLYMVYFMMWNDQLRIDYFDGENRYNGMSIEEFKQLIW